MAKFIELSQSESKKICINIDNILYISGSKHTNIYFNLSQDNKDSICGVSIQVVESYEVVKSIITSH